MTSEHKPESGPVTSSQQAPKQVKATTGSTSDPAVASSTSSATKQTHKSATRRPRAPARTASSKSVRSAAAASQASSGTTPASGEVDTTTTSSKETKVSRSQSRRKRNPAKSINKEGSGEKTLQKDNSKAPKSNSTKLVTEVKPEIKTTEANKTEKPKPAKGKSTTSKARDKLKTIVSSARDAMDVAKNTAKEKEKELGTVSSLQQKIEELKTLPPAPVNTSNLSRRTSLNTGSERAATPTHSHLQAQPLNIPGSSSSAARSSFSSSGHPKLKADAPVFQPSHSPVSASSLVSPPPTEHARVSSTASSQRFNSQSRKEFRNSVADLGEEAKHQITQQTNLYSNQPASFQLLQQQMSQQQPPRHSQQSSLPPRFANKQRGRDMPVYEEEALDDRDLPSPVQHHPQLAPNFQFGARTQSGSASGLNEAMAGMNFGGATDQAGQLGYNSGVGGGAASGINASVLANIAARAGQRHQSSDSYNPILEQQLMLQRQIDLLQEQQRALLQQNTLLQQSLAHPNQLSALSQSLLSQQGQAHAANDMQEQYIKFLTAQSLAQSQQLALQQAQSLAQAQSAASPPQSRSSLLNNHQRDASRASRSGLHDFVLPDMTGAGGGGGVPRPLSASNETAHRTRQSTSGEMGPPAAGIAAHRRRNSVQTHRPQNSIIGSFGGFVADVPDDAVMAHHRANSRSINGDWRNAGGPNKEAVLDLASAQNQLQLLSNFRSNQIGGSGHSKMASFSFPNMLPNLMMASTMGPATQSIVQQQQAFQMQLQQHQGPGPQRKSLFAPYLPQGSLPALLAAGKLVVGVLRVNKRNRSDAYVATDVLEADIYICGSKDRNRALEGDIVAVELLDVDEVWGSKKEKEEKKRKKEENSAYEQGSNKASNARKNDKKKDDVEVEGQGMVLFDDEEVTDDQKPTYAGHVVAVVERMTGQLFSGQLGVLRPSSAATKEKQEAERRERGDDEAGDHKRATEQRPKIVWFKPTDKRVPLIAIPTEQAPPDFIDKPEAFADKLFVATIKRWPITSLHPFGALVNELGSIGDLEVETAALLKDCNFQTDEFQEATLRCLPPAPWSIPEREFEVRRDLRESRVFTIDPPTARDMDDAISIAKTEDGHYEVGVHIADVSYFVRPNTALDRDARKRATSVYLVQRSLPMLPPLLSEQLCSLAPGSDRLAFSALFTIDKDGHVLKKHFAKTIIKSCAKLSYADAQAVIQGGKLEREIEGGQNVDDVAQDIKLLNELAIKLREQRIKDGAFQIDRQELAFVLDDQGKPVDVHPAERKESNELVEEFMLLTNMTVATVIANGLPEQALLRRHEAPLTRRVELFNERAKGLGFDFSGNSAKDLQTGMSKVSKANDKLILQILATRAMNRAKYFCAGMMDISKYSHFALNAPLYTHFTSPIRRYADILVHRMLEASISSEQPETKFVMDRDQVAKCAQHCNAKRDAAKIAEDQSSHLHLCSLIDDLTKKFGPVIRNAQIGNVLENAYDVIVPELGIEKRVHVDKMPLLSHVFDEDTKSLSLYWDTKDVLSYLAANSDDEYVKTIKTDQEATSTGSPKPVEGSVQQAKSADKAALQFENVKTTPDGHRVQIVRELQTVPVMVVADITKSPPVIQCLAVSPFALDNK